MATTESMLSKSLVLKINAASFFLSYLRPIFTVFVSVVLYKLQRLYNFFLTVSTARSTPGTGKPPVPYVKFDNFEDKINDNNQTF